MIVFVISIFGFICLLIILGYSFLPKIRSSIEKASPLFGFIASILALLIFLQFHQTVKDSRLELERHRQEKVNQFNAKMSAIDSELLNNLLLCNVFISEKDGYINGSKIARYKFRYSTIQNAIDSGDILSHELRAKLIAICYQMESANLIMETNYLVSRTSHMQSISKRDQSKCVDAASMQKFSEKVEQIRKRIGEAQSSFEEYWQSPDGFGKDMYLKDDLMQEGLMK